MTPAQDGLVDSSGYALRWNESWPEKIRLAGQTGWEACPAFRVQCIRNHAFGDRYGRFTLDTWPNPRNLEVSHGLFFKTIKHGSARGDNGAEPRCGDVFQRRRLRQAA